jgi:hypothetical protein
MSGVQILNQFEVITETAFNWSAFWKGTLGGLVIALIAGIIFGIAESEWEAFLAMFLVCGIMTSGIMGVLAGHTIDPTVTAYEIHYEVSISEEVNMKEFMDKYEILETRGTIYIVREKD